MRQVHLGSLAFPAELEKKLDGRSFLGLIRGDGGCTCNGKTDIGSGGPNCQTKIDNKAYCYVDAGACSDGKATGKVAKSDYSFLACTQPKPLHKYVIMLLIAVGRSDIAARVLLACVSSGDCFCRSLLSKWRKNPELKSLTAVSFMIGVSQVRVWFAHGTWGDLRRQRVPYPQHYGRELEVHLEFELRSQVPDVYH